MPYFPGKSAFFLFISFINKIAIHVLMKRSYFFSQKESAIFYSFRLYIRTVPDDFSTLLFPDPLCSYTEQKCFQDQTIQKGSHCRDKDNCKPKQIASQHCCRQNNNQQQCFRQMPDGHENTVCQKYALHPEQNGQYRPVHKPSHRYHADTGQKNKLQRLRRGGAKTAHHPDINQQDSHQYQINQPHGSGLFEV